MDLRSEMSCQGTFPRAALTRCENNNVHTLASRLTQETKMNQRADSWKKNLAAIVAKPPILGSGGLLSHTLRCSRGEHPAFYLPVHRRRGLFPGSGGARRANRVRTEEIARGPQGKGTAVSRRLPCQAFWTFSAWSCPALCST